MKWWLISNEVVNQVQQALRGAIDFREEQCAVNGCMCDLAGPDHAQYLIDALHSLNSGMHTTSAVPTDYKAL